MFTVTLAETSGPLAIHVNPGGVVSELITVTTVAGVSLSGFPVLHDTWYPGYVTRPAVSAAHHPQIHLNLLPLLAELTLTPSTDLTDPNQTLLF